MDAAKKEGDDMFSHANEFTDIVAEQNKREEEKRKKAEGEKKREKKRRKASADHVPALPQEASGTSTRESRTASKAYTSHFSRDSGELTNGRRGRALLSPAPSAPPPDSLTVRYDSLAKSALVQDALPQKGPIIIDLADSDDDIDGDNDSGYKSKSFNDSQSFDKSMSFGEDREHDVALHVSKPTPIDDDDPEEAMDPVLAALVAEARQKAAADAELTKGAVAQLFIHPMMDNANPLMVKVRIDSTIEKPRQAWCTRQGFTPEVTKSIFFTWKGQRVYDSTTIKRLGIKVDANGNASMDGDTDIYDDDDEKPLPKVVVQAWTEELFRQHKKEEAAEAAEKKRAAEALPVVKERTPTPEPAPKIKKYRLVLKAKGKEDFKIQINPVSFQVLLIVEQCGYVTGKYITLL